MFFSLSSPSVCLPEVIFNREIKLILGGKDLLMILQRTKQEILMLS
jgi:hypothetical protein